MLVTNFASFYDATGLAQILFGPSMDTTMVLHVVVNKVTPRWQYLCAILHLAPHLSQLL